MHLSVSLCSLHRISPQKYNTMSIRYTLHKIRESRPRSHLSLNRLDRNLSLLVNVRIYDIRITRLYYVKNLRDINTTIINTRYTIYTTKLTQCESRAYEKQVMAHRHQLSGSYGNNPYRCIRFGGRGTRNESRCHSSFDSS
jgi:hypothetical protein